MGRPDHLLRPGLRAGRDGRAVLGLEVPHAAGRGADLDGPPIHGNTRLEIIWTAIPAILLVGLCTYAFVVLEDVEAADGQRRCNVRVVGEQFAWTFYYQRRTARRSPRRSCTCRSTARCKFTLQSKDVLHDFWVPAFRMKKDAVPGIDVTYGVTPNRLGDYPIVCAELCGLGHAAMRATAHVRAEQKFDAWLAKLGKPAAAAAGARRRRRQAAPTARRSSRPDAAAAAATRWPTRARTARSARTSTRCSRARTRPSSSSRSSIPNAEIADGYQRGIMPPQLRPDTLRPAELDALVKYLSEVTKGG